MFRELLVLLFKTIFFLLRFYGSALEADWSLFVADSNLNSSASSAAPSDDLISSDTPDALIFPVADDSSSRSPSPPSSPLAAPRDSSVAKRPNDEDAPELCESSCAARQLPRARRDTSRAAPPPRLQQLYLDAGQKSIGETTCPRCDLVYFPGVARDEATHKAYCEPFTLGVLLPKINHEFILTTVPAVTLNEPTNVSTATSAPTTAPAAAAPTSNRPRQATLTAYLSKKRAPDTAIAELDSPAGEERRVRPALVPTAPAAAPTTTAAVASTARIWGFRAAQVASYAWLRDVLHRVRMY
jgi:hypothetical protein